MRREAALEAVSRYVDGDLSPEEAGEVEEMLATSREARDALQQFLLLRREVRDLPEPPPDLSGPVLDAVRRTPPSSNRLGVKAAAAFAAGILAGVAFIGATPDPPAPLAVADVPAEVVAAQSLVDTLRADLTVVERGRHPEVPERTYRGTISFRSPEGLSIHLDDQTGYPSEEWVPNHLVHVVDEDLEWSRSVARCPTEALPSCTPTRPRITVIRNREPFPAPSISALDVVVPVGGFVRADTPALVGFESRGGREAIGVRVTAAQLAGLIEAFVGRGNWRDVHPTDPVELWLDTDTLVPLAFSVHPADTPDRALWAIRHGYEDRPDMPILEATWQRLQVNDVGETDFDAPPDPTPSIDAGFIDQPPSGLDTTSLRLPEGMELHRTGTIQVGSGTPVSVATWSDGRAWIKLEWTGEWSGRRLFGDLGTPTREIPSPAGVVYANERGDRVALHGGEIDAVLSGSLPTDELVGVVSSLGLAGRPVPGDWEDAATASLEDARRELDTLLLPGALEGFEPPAVRVDEGSVALSYAGAGNRAFVLTQSEGEVLAPPLEADVRSVTVRGVDGRYSPERGSLEWVEDGVSLGLRSHTLSPDELVEIAGSLEAG